VTTRNLQGTSLRLPIHWRGALSLIADLRSVVGSAADRALDLTLPPICAGCYLEGTPLCRDCGDELKLRLAGNTSLPSRLSADRPAPLLQLEWCAPFTGITRRALDRLSDGDERRLSGPLGEAIATRWATAGAGGDVLVPVPTSANRVDERGYDPSVLLARVAGQRLRLPVVEALRRRPAIGPHGIFESTPTGSNDTEGFDVIRSERIGDQWVILVDEVVSSGATLAACADALLGAGARAVSAVTVARDREFAPEGLAALKTG
jgi:predicted amidophosphoribosyltransferase